MKSPSRDLLVLAGKITMNPQEFAHQVELLNNLLYHVECMEIFCTATEIIDVNRHKIINKNYLIQKVARRSVLKPFVFISNKN
jgi:hypothetical protein